jgi:hypothetical protein
MHWMTHRAARATQDAVDLKKWGFDMSWMTLASNMTQCVKPLSDLVTLRVEPKSSRSFNQNCPFGRLSTQSD